MELASLRLRVLSTGQTTSKTRSLNCRLARLLESQIGAGYALRRRISSRFELIRLRCQQQRFSCHFLMRKNSPSLRAPSFANSRARRCKKMCVCLDAQVVRVMQLLASPPSRLYFRCAQLDGERGWKGSDGWNPLAFD